MEITYTIHYKNLGMGAASNLVIIDTVPLNTIYMTGSLRMGDAGSTYNTAATHPPMLQVTMPERSAEQLLTFLIPSIASDDGMPDSGADRGLYISR